MSRGPHPHGYTVDRNDCWVFNGPTNHHGYGAQVTYAKGKKTLAHRAWYIKLVGPVADGLQLDHLCGNRRCVNPAHLEPVTPQENVARSRTAKISRQVATQIRDAYSNGDSLRALAKQHDVTPQNIGRIVRGQTWRTS